MDRLFDKVTCCFMVACLVSGILMLMYLVALLFQGEIGVFIGLFLVLVIILFLFNLIVFCPFTYLIDGLLRLAAKKGYVNKFAILSVHALVSFALSIILASLFRGEYNFHFFYYVPGILCGLLFSPVYKWLAKD
ncbi:hypothetical protein [Paenibacillus sambharensis]|nr:hypothetical protein [Paenibacillus sambharensis]